jgi:SIR2-like protein
MLMVIFGAGASYDYDPSRRAAVKPAFSTIPEPWRPPLANELFDNRNEYADALRDFPECAPIVPYLRGQKDIEQRLEHLQNEASGKNSYPQRLRQLAAVRAYLQLLISGLDRQWWESARGITNHVTLLDQIKRWGNKDALLVTFNYDRLIEEAIALNTGRRFMQITDYVASDPFRLVKLHGSVHWGRVVTGQPFPGNAWEVVHQVIGRADSIESLNHYVISNERPLFADSGTTLMPAIAIPVQSKQHFECPDPHLNLLRERLPEVRRILIIGWRGMDQHFVTLLREGVHESARVQVVCNGSQDSEEVAERLRAAGVRASKWEILGHGFSGYVVERVGDDFLRSTA